LPFYFCSAADGTNVVKVFSEAAELAMQYKENPPSGDFMAEVEETLNYFDKKEQQGKQGATQS